MIHDKTLLCRVGSTKYKLRKGRPSFAHVIEFCDITIICLMYELEVRTVAKCVKSFAILNFFSGVFILIVCVWNTISELHPYYAKYAEGGYRRGDISDAYEATPGIFSHFYRFHYFLTWTRINYM